MIVSELQVILSATLTHLSDELHALRSLGAEPSILDYLLAEGAEPHALNHRAFLYRTWQTYGDDEKMLRSKLSKLNAQCALFLRLYGDGLVNVLRAPARINIIGEHIDYVSYLPTASLPFGSREHDMMMLYRASDIAQVRGTSTFPDYSPFSFELSEGPAAASNGDNQEEGWLDYLYHHPSPAPHWGNYVKGSVYFAYTKYGERVRRGFDFVIDSTIPPSGGASSSSALTVLAGAAIRQTNLIEYAPEDLARDSAQAEWYVGTRGGSMDHITICLAKRQHAVHIGYAEQHTHLVPLPGHRFRWVTFFSHAADKGREVMLEYNERSAVSRVLIPTIIEDWKHSQPDRALGWNQSLEAFQSGSLSALDELQQLVSALPETLTLAEVEREYPDAFRECRLAFPVLVQERRDHPLHLRDRALHHLSEVRRVAAAEQVLNETFHAAMTDQQEQIYSGMRALGDLLNESHESLRDLYGVSTPEVEQLLEIILSDPHIYGAHLMGGGFGGNVLALTTLEQVTSLIDRVQSEFYGPRHREGLGEGSVMVSTPGEGLSALSVENVWRAAIERFNSIWWEAPRYRTMLGSMLDQVSVDAPAAEVWPVIVAAGKGTRAKETGLKVPKPLALVSGVPAIMRVLRLIQAAVMSQRPPLVIVSPETESGIRQALSGEDVILIVQPEARGTGDAVLHAYKQMRDFTGRALIVWGTEPVIQAQTVQRTLKLAAIFDDYEMIVPTALKEQPYAPLLRDHRGRVRAARETHLEGARTVRFGETNIGMFVLRSEAMFETLLSLRQEYWNETEQRYHRPRGELGFPNELINRLSVHETGVMASPLADSREAQGIKSLDDVARCERFISELENEH